MSLPPLLDSAAPADSPAATSEPLPTSPPHAGMNNASPPRTPQRAPLASSAAPADSPAATSQPLPTSPPMPQRGPLASSAAPADSPAATSQPLPTSPPQAGMNNASPPPVPQTAPLASPPSPQVPARQVLPPSMPPVANPPLPSETPVTSPPPITTPTLAPPVPSSPPPPVKPAPPTEATASPVTHPFLPPESPTLPVHSPPLLPISPPPLLPTTLPPSPPPQPPIPPSQPPSTVSPPPVTPPVTIPSPPKVIPPPATTSPIVPPPTTPSNPPPAPPLSWVLPSPPPPSAMISSPPSSQLANRTLSMSSKEFHISVGLIVACAIGGFFLFLVLCYLYLFCKENRRRNSTIKQHYDRSTFLAPKDTSKNVQAQHSQKTGLHSGESVITVQTEAFPLRHPMASNARSGSMNSPAFVNTLPPQAPRDAPFGLPNGGFTYDELVVATNGFSDANLLGQGGFGYVHKGLLPCGKEIAVKQLKEGSLQGKREFQAEVEIVCRVHHKHLVSLVGYCINGAARLLVYEFVPNNTLEFHLHGSGQPVIEWGTRLKIAIGSAKGLSYLHEDCNPKIIHRDIKAANILLDHDFEGKVSDFGLAKSFSGSSTSSTHISTRVVGTFGYMAPEYALIGKLTDKSDVYSYGVVLLELITGRPPICTTESVMNESLVTWARPLLTRALEEGNFEAVADPRLRTNYNTNQMASMVACAAACLHHSSWVRPRMSQVVHALQGGMSGLDLNEGIFRLRHSTLYGSSRSSSSNTHEYMDYTKNFDMAMSNRQHGISVYTGTTSEYGLNPSSSSSDNGR